MTTHIGPTQTLAHIHRIHHEYYNFWAEWKCHNTTEEDEDCVEESKTLALSTIPLTVGLIVTTFTAGRASEEEGCG
eukprot:11660756-Ditylum_brightwellii.AAC.1